MRLGGNGNNSVARRYDSAVLWKYGGSAAGRAERRRERREEARSADRALIIARVIIRGKITMTRVVRSRRKDRKGERKNSYRDWTQIPIDRLFNAIIARQFNDAAFPFARTREGYAPAATNFEHRVSRCQLRRCYAINDLIIHWLNLYSRFEKECLRKGVQKFRGLSFLLEE